MNDRVRKLREQVKEIEKKFDSGWSSSHTAESHPLPRGCHGRQMNSKRIEETEDNQKWFVREIKCMKKILSRGFQELLQEEIDVYVDEFRKCRMDYMCEVLSGIRAWNRFPIPAELKDEYRRIVKKHHDDDVSHRLSKPQPDKEKSDEAAIMAMMHVHYKLGISIGKDDGIAAYFKTHFGDRPFDVKLMEQKLPKDTVADWIAKNDKKEDLTGEQPKQGPSPGDSKPPPPKVKIVGNLTRISCEVN